MKYTCPEYQHREISTSQEVTLFVAGKNWKLEHMMCCRFFESSGRKEP